jgi:hypothetical protein
MTALGYELPLPYRVRHPFRWDRTFVFLKDQKIAASASAHAL